MECNGSLSESKRIMDYDENERIYKTSAHKDSRSKDSPKKPSVMSNIVKAIANGPFMDDQHYDLMTRKMVIFHGCVVFHSCLPYIPNIGFNWDSRSWEQKSSHVAAILYIPIWWFP